MLLLLLASQMPNDARKKVVDDEENFNDFDVDEMVELLDIII